ncbi:cache domain-containing protein [Thiotrichales bacterium HSG1]|nr:cache domain-containing protein [Thiotrichales bacterium HSG1]
MKNFLTLGMLTISLCFAGSSFAGDGDATKEECVDKSKEAAVMLKEDKAAAIDEIANKEGKFVWKNTYVFLVELPGKMLAHPMKPSLKEHPNLLEVTDKNEDKSKAKLIFEEFKNVAQSETGEGWVTYQWTTTDGKIADKETFIYRVKDTEMYVGAGIYK